MNVVIQRLDTGVSAPEYAHEKGTSGFDLVCKDVVKIYSGSSWLSDGEVKKRILIYPNGSKEVILLPFERALFSTKQQFIIPDGYEIQIRPKSGVTLKTGVLVQLGTIDADYTGDNSISVVNCNTVKVYVPLNSKLAQGVLVKVERAYFNTISEQTFNGYQEKSNRKTGGFGSTGTSVN